MKGRQVQTAFDIDELVPGYKHDEQLTIIGDHVLFVRIGYSEGEPNPCKDIDGFGMIRSLSRKHVNSIRSKEELDGILEDKDVVALSYFEHGQCTWGVLGTMGEMPDFRWDGTRFAGVWIPDKYVKESYSKKRHGDRRKWMEQQAASACETYTQWCNGEVYYYGVLLHRTKKSESGQVYDHPDDYRFETSLASDSCGGLYGREYAEKEARRAALYALNKHLPHEATCPGDDTCICVKAKIAAKLKEGENSGSTTSAEEHPEMVQG